MARKEVVPIPYTARLHPEKGEYMAVRYWSPEGKRKTKSLGYRGTEEYRKNYAEFMALYEQMFESGLDPASVKKSKEEISPKEHTLGEILIYAWDNVVPDLYQTASGEVKREWYTAKHVVTDFTKPLHHKLFRDVAPRDLESLWRDWAMTGKLQGSTVRSRITMLKRLLERVMFKRDDMVSGETYYRLKLWKPPSINKLGNLNRGVREKEQNQVATDQEIWRMISYLREKFGPDSIAALVLLTIRTSSIRPGQLITGGHDRIEANTPFLPVEWVEVRGDSVLIRPTPKSRKRSGGSDLFISTNPEVILGFQRLTEGKSASDPVFDHWTRKNGSTYFRLLTFQRQIEKARKAIQESDPEFRDFTSYWIRHRARDVLRNDPSMSEMIIGSVMNHEEKGTQSLYGSRRLEDPIRKGVEVLQRSWACFESSEKPAQLL